MWCNNICSTGLILACPANCKTCASNSTCDECYPGYKWDETNNNNIDRYFCVKGKIFKENEVLLLTT